MTARDEMNRIYDTLSVSGKAEFIYLLLYLCGKCPADQPVPPALRPLTENRTGDS